MNIYTISALINSTVSLFFGGLIWYKSENRLLGNTFAFFSLTLVLWSFGYVFWQLSSNPQDALFWSRFLMIGAIYTPITFYHFTLAFVNRVKNHTHLLYSGYLIFTIFAINNLTDTFVSGVEPVLSFPYWPQPGILFHLFLIIWVIYAVLALYHLYSSYQSTDEAGSRLQISYLLVGAVIGYLGAITNYFLWYDIKIPPVGTISPTLFSGLVAYAIVKHQLFNIKIIVTELFSWLLVATLAINLFFSDTTPELIKNVIILLAVSASVYWLVQSVYKEVKAREEEEKLTKKLKQLNKQKSRMLSIASHQFRSPLTSIEGYASLMKEKSYGDIPEGLEAPINRILKSSKQLSHIVDDFLNISRIEQGRMNYDFEVKDMKDVVNDVVKEMEPKVEDNNLYIKFITDDNKTYPARMDKEKIQQVVRNLIDNGIKYTHEGGLTIRLKQQDHAIKTEVKDTGMGISSDDQEEIFNQFSRADEAKDAEVTGSGLGLYIARKIIEDHDGDIWATSPGKGKGSTFHVRIPTAETSND